MPNNSNGQAFGSAGALPAVPTTSVLIATILVIITLEYVFKFFNDLTGKVFHMSLFQSILQYEIVVLGLISFAIFLTQEALSNDPNNEESIYFNAFSLINLIITFIAIALTLQVFILMIISLYDGINILKSTKIPATELLKHFDRIDLSQLTTSSSTTGVSGFYAQLPLFYWNKVELKIIQQLFYQCHGDNLPPGFNYGAYFSYLYHIYIAEVSRISPFSWLGLALLVFFNYIKNVVIPNHIECDLLSAAHVEQKLINCHQSYFSYPLFLGVVLLLSLMMLALASNYYYEIFIRYSIKKAFHIKIDTSQETLCSLFSCRLLLAKMNVNYVSPIHRAYIQCLEKLQQQVTEVSLSPRHQPPHQSKDKESKSQRMKKTGMMSEYSHYQHHTSNTNTNTNTSTTNTTTNMTMKSTSIRHEQKSSSSLQIDENINTNTNTNTNSSSSPSSSSPHKLQPLHTTHINQYTCNESSSSSYASYASYDQDEHHHPSTSPIHPSLYTPSKHTYIYDHDPSTTTTTTTDESEFSKYLKTLEKTKNEKDHQRQLFRLKPWYQKIFYYMYKFITYLQTKYSDAAPELKKLYFLRSSSLYFFFIEFLIFMHSVYIAIVLSQILPTATNKHYYGWAIALSSVPLIGFMLIRYIISKSVILYSVTRLNKEVMIRICDESDDVYKVTKQIQYTITQHYKNLGLMSMESRIQYVLSIFDTYALTYPQTMLNQLEFRQFLDSLNIILSDYRFSLLWKVIDDDLSGYLSKEEVLYYFFPEEKLALQKEMILIYKLNKFYCMMMKDFKIPIHRWVEEIYNIMIEYNERQYKRRIQKLAKLQKNQQHIGGNDIESGGRVSQLGDANSSFTSFNKRYISYEILYRMVIDSNIQTNEKEVKHLIKSVYMKTMTNNNNTTATTTTTNTNATTSTNASGTDTNGNNTNTNKTTTKNNSTRLPSTTTTTTTTSATTNTNNNTSNNNTSNHTESGTESGSGTAQMPSYEDLATIRIDIEELVKMIIQSNDILSMKYRSRSSADRKSSTVRNSNTRQSTRQTNSMILTRHNSSQYNHNQQQPQPQQQLHKTPSSSSTRQNSSKSAPNILTKQPSHNSQISTSRTSRAFGSGIFRKSGRRDSPQNTDSAQRVHIQIRKPNMYAQDSNRHQPNNEDNGGGLTAASNSMTEDPRYSALFTQNDREFSQQFDLSNPIKYTSSKSAVIKSTGMSTTNSTQEEMKHRDPVNSKRMSPPRPYRAPLSSERISEENSHQGDRESDYSLIDSPSAVVTGTRTPSTGPGTQTNHPNKLYHSSHSDDTHSHNGNSLSDVGDYHTNIIQSPTEPTYAYNSIKKKMKTDGSRQYSHNSVHSNDDNEEEDNSYIEDDSYSEYETEDEEEDKEDENSPPKRRKSSPNRKPKHT